MSLNYDVYWTHLYNAIVSRAKQRCHCGSVDRVWFTDDAFIAVEKHILMCSPFCWTTLYNTFLVIHVLQSRGGLGPQSGPGLYGRSGPLLGVSEGYSSATAGGSRFEKFVENDLPNGEKIHIFDDLIHLQKTIYESIYTSKMFTSM